MFSPRGGKPTNVTKKILLVIDTDCRYKFFCFFLNYISWLCNTKEKEIHRFSRLPQTLIHFWSDFQTDILQVDQIIYRAALPKITPQWQKLYFMCTFQYDSH